MVIEEVLRGIEYHRCPDCFGDRRKRSPGFGRCERCDGWGYVVDPPALVSRIALGLAALHGGVIEVKTRPRKRLILPSRRKKRVTGASG
jgi:hypothetical protein